MHAYFEYVKKYISKEWEKKAQEYSHWEIIAIIVVQNSISLYL